MATNYACYNEVNKMEFYVLGSEENYIDGAVSVTNKELFKGDKPIPGGCYDAHMGTTEYNWDCLRCLNKRIKCPGHAGSCDLRGYVKSPLFRDYIIKWLKIICFKCGRLIVDKDINTASNKLLGEYVKLSKGIDKCPWPDCNEPHPTITKDKFKPSVFYADYKTGKTTKREEMELYNHAIADIFDRISDETIIAVGKPVKCPPRNLMLNIIRVPPNTIRPDIKRIGGSRSNNSDITALMKNIVEINELLPIEIPPNNEISSRLNEMYFNLDITYYGMIKGSSSTNNQVRLVTSTNKAPMSLASRQPRKEGRVRRNLMGKRVGYMMRSVISGDNSLRVDEIGIPIKLASALQIPETVNSYNKDKLNIYYKNRRNVYPGCSGIFIKKTDTFHMINHLDPTYELAMGDIVYRDHIEGDYIGFNRQPSLLFGQLGSHKIKIMEKSNTIRINVSACAPYNASISRCSRIKVSASQL